MQRSVAQRSAVWCNGTATGMTRLTATRHRDLRCRWAASSARRSDPIRSTRVAAAPAVGRQNDAWHEGQLQSAMRLHSCIRSLSHIHVAAVTPLHSRHHSRSEPSTTASLLASHNQLGRGAHYERQTKRALPASHSSASRTSHESLCSAAPVLENRCEQPWTTQTTSLRPSSTSRHQPPSLRVLSATPVS